MRFKLGQTMMTRGIQQLTTEGLNPCNLLNRHCRADWGELDASDWALNDDAMLGGEDRILSAYTWHGHRIYVITEHDRSYTTVMLANEY